MSTLFGPIRQIAFIVRDLDHAVDYWTKTLGVGPFFVMREVYPEEFRYRGKASPPPLTSVALGNSGDLQIEIIAQHDERPSAYLDFLEAGNEGFQHVSAWLDRAGYDETRARMTAAGSGIAHEGAIPGVNVRFAYFATDAPAGGFLYEISDVLEPTVYPVMQAIAEAARDWDGSDPVRELSI